MSDELFEAYKIMASELLKAKVPFGEHQRRAFEIIVGAEIERLKGAIIELTKHVQLGAEHKKDPIWAMLKAEMANQGYHTGYGSVATFDFAEKPLAFAILQKTVVDCEAFRQGGFQAKPGFFGRIKSLQHFRSAGRTRTNFVVSLTARSLPGLISRRQSLHAPRAAQRLVSQSKALIRRIDP